MIQTTIEKTDLHLNLGTKLAQRFSPSPLRTKALDRVPALRFVSECCGLLAENSAEIRYSPSPEKAAESLLWKKANRPINAIHGAGMMTVELRTLALNAVLGLGQIVLGSQLTGRDA